MAQATLSRIDHPPETLRDRVQKSMRAAIIDGVFGPGERLVERPLCEQLGVSRTVVRETIRYLEAEGLVEIIAGQGPIAARLSRADAIQIYDIRQMLEAAAAKACASRITAKRAARLKSAFRSLEGAFGETRPGALHDATTSFYAEIFDGAGHQIAWSVVQRLNGRISRLRAMTLAVKDRDVPGIVHMERICSAVVSGDGAAAEAAVTAHISDAKRIAERILDAEDAAPRE